MYQAFQHSTASRAERGQDGLYQNINSNLNYQQVDSIPACLLRLVCDLYNPMIHTSTVHARGNIACYFQSTHQYRETGN